MEIRLDNLVALKKNISRSRAQALIKEGKVEACGKIVTKPAFMLEDNAEINLLNDDNYVSRGAYKLKKALEFFDVSVEGKVVLDMGASTGGFTQVALENGAEKVYSVDVGTGELDKSLISNPRVVNMQGTDIRLVQTEMVVDTQIVVGDLSFISLRHILPKIKALFGKIECILLFKPQFECGKELARKFKGIIKDKAVHKALLKEFIQEINSYEYNLSEITFSPIKGKNGNVEYLLHLNGKNQNVIDVNKIVDNAFAQVN